jgi:sortase (surface protein transpeptidase)
MRLALLAALLATLLGLSGCGAPPSGIATPESSAAQAAPTESISTAPTPTAPAHTAPAPTGVAMPRIGIKSTAPLIPLGLDDDMHLEVPDVHTPQVGGWFKSGPWPGEKGPAVIAGHVSGRPPGSAHSVPGLFARLPEARVGDEVTVTREDGSTVRFAVYAVRSYPKDRFATAEVYGDTPDPELRLITCSGSFNEATHHYDDNTVAFARQAGPG